MTELPPGFKPLERTDAVGEWIGPVYARVEPDHVAIGFWVEERHCNGRGRCHGGVLAIFADMQLGLNVTQVTKMGGPTISLTLDFLDAATPGMWVEGRTEFLKRTPNMSFVQCIATADGAPVLRASAIFRSKSPRVPRV
jgi:acyl-coenzyme A thioesterase PaaI-like protein